MIELAPTHKSGLTLANPVLLAAGSAGMGEATHDALDLSILGAVVVGPLTRRSRAGADTPRIAEIPGGIVLDTGGQNRGLDATLRRFAALWGRLPIPVIVQLIDADPRLLADCAARLAAVEGVVAIEWMPPTRMETRRLRSAIEQLLLEGDLPLLVRIPLFRTLEWGKAAVEAGAHALVIGAPPEAAAPARGAENALVKGFLYGPGVFPLMLGALLETVQTAEAEGWDVPLVASGGIHTVEQARTALDAGATALQIDIAAWVEPEVPGVIAQSIVSGR